MTFPYQLRCLNDLLAETRRQGIREREDDAWVEKMTFFYNNEQDDSLWAELPPTQFNQLYRLHMLHAKAV